MDHRKKRCPPSTVRTLSGRCVPRLAAFGGPASSPWSFGSSRAAAAPNPTPLTPPIPSCFDILTVVPFSVPQGAPILISGGGAALSAAIVGAPSGAVLLIQDSLDYSPITITGKTDLTIMADVGQTPTITAAALNNAHCVTLGTGNNGIALLGLTFIGAGNAQAPGAPGQAQSGLINYNNGAGGLRRLIVEDCTFIEPAATVNSGAPGIWLRGTTGGVTQQDIWVHRCTFVNVGASLAAANTDGYGAVTIGGFSNMYVQNCLIQRQDSVIARNVSPMRGVVIKGINGIVEDVLCDDIGTGGSNQNFLIPTGASFGTASGTVAFRNCVSYNGRFGYAIAVAGSTMVVQNCVYYADQLGITSTAVFLSTVGALTFQDSVSFGAGDGFAFTPDPLGSPIVENHNDVFNFGTIGRTLDPTDISINPLFQDVPDGDFVAVAPACRVAAADGGAVGVRYPGGEKIIWCNG